MSRLILLGTGNAVSKIDQDNTHMALLGGERRVLIDASTNPIIRLRLAGIDPIQISDLILTHFHPDHVSGVPIFLMDSWLLGRKAPLAIHGLALTLDKLQKMMDLYNWENWPDFFPVYFHSITAKEKHLVIEADEFSIFSSPVRHMIPNIGLRFEFSESGKSIAYSSDTEPAQEVIRLAEGVDILLHEATGEELGHSSPAQAGLIAQQAGAKRLFLIHYDRENNGLQEFIEQAKSTFPGPVDLAEDLMSFDY